MLITLLRTVAGIMILVPVGTVTTLAVFPEEIRLIPLSFWVVWFLVSVWAAVDAPARFELLTRVARVRESPAYAKWAMIVALANVASSMAAVMYLGWWS